MPSKLRRDETSAYRLRQVSNDCLLYLEIYCWPDQLASWRYNSSRGATILTTGARGYELGNGYHYERHSLSAVPARANGVELRPVGLFLDFSRYDRDGASLSGDRGGTHDRNHRWIAQIDSGNQLLYVLHCLRGAQLHAHTLVHGSNQAV